MVNGWYETTKAYILKSNFLPPNRRGSEIYFYTTYGSALKIYFIWYITYGLSGL